MTGTWRIAIDKGGATVVGPRHFPDTGVSLHARDAETLAKRPCPQVHDEFLYRGQESPLLGGGEAIEVLLETFIDVVRRHRA